MLVVKALAVVESKTPSASVLESTGLVQQLVHAAYVCRRCRRGDQDDWDDISERLSDFLKSVREKFESYHADWNEGDLYIDWDGLN